MTEIWQTEYKFCIRYCLPDRPGLVPILKVIEAVPRMPDVRLLKTPVAGSFNRPRLCEGGTIPHKTRPDSEMTQRMTARPFLIL
jgi:hypothetical protein